MTDFSNINASPAPDRRDALARQASIWVSQTFFGTMLKQMRNSPFRSELFSGGRGGQMFASLLDQRLSERMTRGAAQPLVRSIVKHLERTGQGLHVAPGTGN
jgi:Rod binding domain-containing protein